VVKKLKLDNYIKRLKKWVQMEREEEMRQHLLEMKNLSGVQRERKGRAMINMRAKRAGKAFGNQHLIKYMKEDYNDNLPNTEIQVGDIVSISYRNPLDKKNPTGTVVEKSRFSVTVGFDKMPHKLYCKKGLRVDLTVNDVTYQRMLDAIGNFNRAKGRLRDLRNVLLGQSEPRFSKTDFNMNYALSLNMSQKRSVQEAVNAKDVFLIHGPPGTGKTQTLIELMYQGAKLDRTILATAHTNTAVDNMVERLAEVGLNAVRIGHPCRVNKFLQEHTLDLKIVNHPVYETIEMYREKINAISEEQKDFTPPTSRWTRGMSKDEIRKLAAAKRGNRGVSAMTIEGMNNWLELQDEKNQLFDKMKALESDAVNEILEDADVICATNSTSGADVLSNHKFDWVVIDEATQCTESSALIPLVKGKKVILAGDHKQLPPTVICEKAKSEGYSVSVFERLIGTFGRDIKALLEIQYRMNQEIMDFSNKHFYENRLIAHETVKNHSIDDFNLDFSHNAMNAVYSSKPTVFIDMGNGDLEQKRAGATSYYNTVEGESVVQIVKSYLKAGAKPEDIAVITPYKEQAAWIRRHLSEEDIEVNTVDSFQGREKEIVIMSLTRCNSRGEIGFLNDLRRLNVSITRAKKKLIVIGNKETISSHPIYKDFVSTYEA